MNEDAEECNLSWSFFNHQLDSDIRGSWHEAQISERKAPLKNEKYRNKKPRLGKADDLLYILEMRANYSAKNTYFRWAWRLSKTWQNV